jgi:hypothetical protein
VTIRERFRGIRFLTALVPAVVVGVGCGADDADRENRIAGRSPAATTSPTPAPVQGQQVGFRATDRQPVSGVLTIAETGAPALVLVHQSDGGAEHWDAFVPYLQEAGFSTLAYDGRGGLDERELVSETEGAVEFLDHRRDVGAIGVVGASIGANTAALALARDRGRRLQAGVALSPADSVIAERMQATGRYRPHHLLVVADPDEFPAAQRFLRGAIDARAVKTREYGHGVDLLGGGVVAGHDADRTSILRWLTSQFR